MKEKMENRPELNARQQCLLAELVRTPDIQAAAKAAGVGRTSAYRWLEEPAFAEELARLRNEVVNKALGSVKAQATRAAEELQRLLDTDNERLRRLVCKDILSYSIRVRELEEIERRVVRLEERMKDGTKGALR